jgi:hypothetical protein
MSFQVADYDHSADFLYDRGWPPGLIDAFHAHTNETALRFVVIDNSSSMKRNDGYRIATNQDGVTKLVLSFISLSFF